MNTSDDAKKGPPDWAIIAFILGCWISIASGVTLAIYFDNPWWLLLSLPIFLFPF
jgi:hypothetical protein